MNPKTIVLNSEEEFRKSLLQDSSTVSQIIVVKNESDETIYFYYFTGNGQLHVAKELTLNRFSSYKKMYKRFAEELGLSVFPGTSQLITAKL